MSSQHIIPKPLTTSRLCLRSLIFAICIIFSCFSFSCKKNVPLSELTLDQIAVESIQTPTKYRYGPCSGQLEITIATNIDKKTTLQTAYANYSVIEEGQRLIWHIFIPKWKENGRIYSPFVPLIDMTMDTDFRGTMGSSNVTFPLIQSLGKTISPKIRKKVESLKKELSLFNDSLPEEGITTGDSLFNKTLPPPPPGFKLEATDVSYTLTGEFIKDLDTYVVASLNERIPFTDMASGVQTFMVINGYVIFFKSQMELVKSESEITIYSPMGTPIAYSTISMIRKDK